MVDLEFQPRFGWIQGLCFSLCAISYTSTYEVLSYIGSVFLFIMNDCIYSTVFCLYSLKELGGFSVRKRHSFKFERLGLNLCFSLLENFTTFSASWETEQAKKKRAWESGKDIEGPSWGSYKNWEKDVGKNDQRILLAN